MTGLHAALAALADEWSRIAERWDEHLPRTAIHRAHANRLRKVLAAHPADLPVATDSTTAEIEDGFGGYWTTCGPGCDLEVVRPGKVQCNRTSSACPDAPVPEPSDSTAAALIERSSFGTPEAVALRASVSDEVAARVVARAKELEADAPAPAPEPSDRAGLSEAERGEAYYREHGWSGCDGSSWERLPTATRDGWEHAARLADRLAAAERERDEARGVRDELGAAYREAIGVPESQHQRARMERIASALEEAEAEIERLNNQVASVEALADEMADQHGQCWNSLFARRLRAALGDPGPWVDRLKAEGAIEALERAASDLSARTEGTDRVRTETWRPNDRDVYSLAIEDARAELHRRARVLRDGEPS